MIAFIDGAGLSDVFQWATILAIAIAAVAVCGKLLIMMRSTKNDKKSDYYYPAQVPDSPNAPVTLEAQESYEVGTGDLKKGRYRVLGNDNTKILINGKSTSYNNGEFIFLDENDVVEVSGKVHLHTAKKQNNPAKEIDKLIAKTAKREVKSAAKKAADELIDRIKK